MRLVPLLVLLTAACNGRDKDAVDSAPLGPEPTALGVGDGVLPQDQVVWTPILGEEDNLTDPRDLGFDLDGNLWIANREDDRTFIVFNPGTEDQDYDRRRDAAAEHFMEETAAFSFEGLSGAGPFGPEFGSCGETRNTYNDRARPNNFMGPVLWATDLEIFAEQDPYGLGSHLDMLHQSPNCVGLAWERDNIYWVFDGHNDTVVRYDFGHDHGVGQDDHSDGIVYRVTDFAVTRVEEAPGHMAIDHDTGRLYIADTGAGRVLWLDTQSGEKGETLSTRNEPLQEYTAWINTDYGELVTGLNQPGGLALDGLGYLYVGEFGTGIIHVYTLDGVEIQTLDTGLGPGVLYGIEIGPDGRLWVAETLTPGVFRLDP